MTWKTPPGGFAVVTVLAVLAASVLGCGQPKEAQEAATTELGLRIDDLEKRLGDIEQGVADLGVTIKVKGTGSGSTLEWVRPKKKKVCKVGQSGCPTKVNWHLLSEKDLDTGWQVVVREKPSSVDKDCFKPVSGTDWILTKKGQSESSGTSYCDVGAEWKYDVFLMENGVVRSHIDPLFYLPFI